MKIDYCTLPPCKIEEKTFEWGEPYETITPIFNFEISDKKCFLAIIELLANNNFKEQLLRIRNKLINKETHLIVHIDAYLLEDIGAAITKVDQRLICIQHTPSPWEKYGEYFAEKDYYYHFEEALQIQLPYVELA